MDCDGGTQHHFEFEGEYRYKRQREAAAWCGEMFGSEHIMNRRWWVAGPIIIIFRPEDAFHFKMRWG